MLLARLGPREGYQQLEIRVFDARAAGQPYPVEMSAPRWPDFPRGQLKLDIAALNASGASVATYGQMLGEALFADDCLGPSYREALAAVQEKRGGVRVRLRLDPLELEPLHWERLYQPMGGGWQPVGTTATTPFSRYVPSPRWSRPPLVTERPLRMLAVVASPADLDAYGLDAIDQAERDAPRTSLVGLPDVALSWLETGTAARPTLEGLRRALAEGPHLVHILCHGAATANGSVLYLERADGTTDAVSVERLVSCFNTLTSPPLLCYLAACESARRGRADGLAALGPSLVADGGLQAVIAMTARVGVPTARRFADQFYQRLLKHGVVDQAVNEARATVQESADWSVPVLLSRLQDNQLLDFPVGRIYTESLAHSDLVFATASQALAAAQRDDPGQQFVADLRQLIDELSKSHKVLVGVASDYRDVGDDPATFEKQFKAFYTKFKRYYDGQDWVQEDTSRHVVDELRGRVLPPLQTLLDSSTFAQVEHELRLLSNADGSLLDNFRAFLDSMDGAVEKVGGLLRNGDTEAAIEAKLDFEAQISPSARRSREMLGQMSASTARVQAA
ncbi:MAG: CHAT domain-containing protein [Chloroflexi bacterium]|nr:CHAT domain-containing protein [Chloroflexota bacterium]